MCSLQERGFIMKISTKGRYALRVMIDLAENNDGNFISLKDISKDKEYLPNMQNK